jgi:hypothetical protein
LNFAAADNSTPGSALALSVAAGICRRGDEQGTGHIRILKANFSGVVIAAGVVGTELTACPT